MITKNTNQDSEKAKRTESFKNQFLSVVAEYNNTLEPPQPPNKYAQFIETERAKRIQEDKNNIVQNTMNKLAKLDAEIGSFVTMYEAKIDELKFPPLKNKAYQSDEIAWQTFTSSEFTNALLISRDFTEGDFTIFDVINKAWTSNRKHFASHLIDALMLRLNKDVVVEGIAFYYRNELAMDTEKQKWFETLNSYRNYEFDAELKEFIIETSNLKYLQNQIHILQSVMLKYGYVKRLLTQFDNIQELPSEYLQSEFIKEIDWFNQYYLNLNANLLGEKKYE